MEVIENEVEQDVNQDVAEEKAEYEVSPIRWSESTQVESGPEETPMTEAENQLCEISNAERVCRARECDVESAKEELKAAKASYDVAVTRLRNLAEAAFNDSSRPLLSQDNGTADAASDAEPNDGWKSEPIETLWTDSEIKGLWESKTRSVD